MKRRRKKNKKILALCLAALLAASNVVPVIAAYGEPAGDRWQGILDLDSMPIMKSSLRTGETGEGSPSETKPEEPTESAAPTTGGNEEGSPGGPEDEPTVEDSSTEESIEGTLPAESEPVDLMLSRAAVVVEIKTESQLEALFPDDAFRAVVFKAVKGLKGGGDSEEEAIKAALANFTGTINANKKGIREIDGIQYLIHADTIKLEHNEIEDFRPAKGEKEHYGYRPSEITADEIDGREGGNNVFWSLGGNPFRFLPNDFGGKLVIDQPGTTSYTYLDGNEVFKFIRGDKEFFSSQVNIKRCEIESSTGSLEPVRIISGMKFLHGFATVSDHNNESAQITGIKKSGLEMLAVPVDEELHYQTEDEYGTITPGSQSFKYYIQPEFWVYDKVILEVSGYSGKVALHKRDEDEGTKAIPGVKFQMYHSEGTLASDKVFVTDQSGNITVSDLASGDYYFIETAAAEGYDLDNTKIDFSVPAPEVKLTGGEPKVVSADGSEVKPNENEVFITGTAVSQSGNRTINSPDILLTAAVAPSSVSVTYGQMEEDGAVKSDVVKKFGTLSAAAADVNTKKNENRILGLVKISVNYKSGTGASAYTKDIKVTNAKRFIDISGTKEWIDDSDYTGGHPAMSIKLMQNGAEYQRKDFPEGKMEDLYEYNFTNLERKDSNGVPYTYTIEEEFVDSDYMKDFFLDTAGYNLTNAHKGAKRDIMGKKTWDDLGYSVTHPAVTIDLYRDGSIIDSCTVLPGQETFHFANLPVADESKTHRYEYTLKEQPAANYNSVPVGKYSFHNVYVPPTTPPPEVPEEPPVTPPVTPPVNPPSSSHGGGGGGGGGIPPGKTPPTGPGVTPQETLPEVPTESVPPTPDNPSDNPEDTDPLSDLNDSDNPQGSLNGRGKGTLPKTGEEDSPVLFMIFFSGILSLAGWITGRQKEVETERRKDAMGQ